MKQTILYTLLLYALILPKSWSQSKTEGGTINWHTISDIDSLIELGDKKILIDVFTPWCAPCHKMDEYTFKDKRIARYINAHFYPVKFDGESKDTIQFKSENYLPTKKTHELTLALSISAYPTLLFFDEKGILISKEAKFFSPNELEIALHYIYGNHYKTSSYSIFKANYQFE